MEDDEILGEDQEVEAQEGGVEEGELEAEDIQPLVENDHNSVLLCSQSASSSVQHQHESCEENDVEKSHESKASTHHSFYAESDIAQNEGASSHSEDGEAEDIFMEGDSGEESEQQGEDAGRKDFKDESGNVYLDSVLESLFYHLCTTIVLVLLLCDFIINFLRKNNQPTPTKNI